MDFQTFFSQLFSDLDTAASLQVLAILLGFFLLGFLFGWLSTRSRANRLQRELDARTRELSTLRGEHTALSERYDLKLADMRKLELELQSEREHKRRLETEKGNLHGEVYGLKEERDALQQQLEDSRTTQRALDNQVVGLQTKLNQLQAARDGDDDAISDLMAVQSKLAAGQNHIADLERRIESLQAENEQLRHAEAAEATTDSDASGMATTKDGLSLSPDLADTKAVVAKDAVIEALGKKIPKAAATDKDDLTLINGIGPFLEKKLNGIGIYTFAQIAAFDDEMARMVTQAIQFFPGRIQRDEWTTQARRLETQQDADAVI